MNRRYYLERPVDPDAVPLHVTESGTTAGLDGGRPGATKRREPLASVRLTDVLHMCGSGGVQVTAKAGRSLPERDVDAFHCSCGG